jgi:hypothetical protein
MELSKMTVGPHGWVRFTIEGVRGDLFVRLRPGDDGRWRIHEVYLDSTRPISAQDLRGIPYAQCEEWANLEAEVLAGEWEVVDAVGDNMAVLASHLGVAFGRLGGWVAEAYRASADPKAPRKWKRGPRKRTHVSTDPDPSFRLTEGPTSRELSDEFLEQVARAYRAALARGERPNKTMAEDLGWVERRTVERWVAKARDRGYLGPARKGAAG